ncbi:MAG: hypothetical protein ABSG54_02250 [Terriglobia bacterium]|jgi:hypothetical protein
MIDEQEVHEVSPPAPAKSNRWLLVATLFFLATTLGGAFYLVEQRREAAQMAANHDQMSAVLNQTRIQLDAVTTRLAALSTPPEVKPAPQEPVPQPKEASPAKTHRNKHVQTRAQKRVPADDPRWKKVQAELDEHQKQIEAGRQDLQNARTDLEGKLGSTRDELGGSIARTHEELVALQKRGEKNYFEFDLTKSKQFSHVGPLSISLRKANTKRQYCDLELIVDDNRISQKHTNLYEPVMLYPSDYAQPVEVVINSIGKGGVRGYVSAPKYRQSQLASGNAPEPTASQPATSTANLERRPASTPQ